MAYFFQSASSLFGISDKVFAILRQYSPEVHAISIDEGIVDLTGTEKLLGPPLQTADRIIRRIEQELGLPSSAGLSTHRVVSKIAATLAKPRGLIFVAAGDERDFLAPLPVELVPGIGPKTQKQFFQRGIQIIGDLLHSELDRATSILGEATHRERHHDHSIGNETTLEKALKDIEPIGAGSLGTCRRGWRRLRKENYYARSLVSRFATVIFRRSRGRVPPSPTCFDREIFEVVSELLKQTLPMIERFDFSASAPARHSLLAGRNLSSIKKSAGLWTSSIKASTNSARNTARTRSDRQRRVNTAVDFNHEAP